jgi:hypothetical protein
MIFVGQITLLIKIALFALSTIPRFETTIFISFRRTACVSIA